MGKKQLFVLFSCNLLPYIVANGLLPLLPVYARYLGAENVTIGYYLAFTFFALATGTVLAGWLSDKLQRRKILLIPAAVLAIPAIWLIGRVTDMWHLAMLTATLWFLLGIGVALVNILTGLAAGEKERGKIFGILAMTIGLGSLIGGLTIGPIADKWGYTSMFEMIALFLVFWPLIGLFLEDRVVTREQHGLNRKGSLRSVSGILFLLLLANLVAMTASFLGNLGRSLAMNEMGFSSAAISSTAAASGAAALPFPPLIGWLSDRLGRKRFMAVCYLAGATGLAILSVSVSLWHFWAAFSLLAVLVVSYSVGSALTMDLVTKDSIGMGLSLLSATSFIGGIIGFASTGYAVQHLGITPTFVIGAFLPMIALILLIPIRQPKRKEGT
jgi:MFS family permease